MKRVLCYGDSNTFGMAPMRNQDDARRFGPADRWPGAMRAALGAGWEVIEEGHPGRTTVHDDPIEGAHKNGRTYLLPCLESHWPLDAIALMLGTNDLKARYGLTPWDIAAGAGKLLEIVNASVPPWTRKPKLLLICPPPVREAGWLAPMFAGGAAKSRKLAPLYRTQAKRNGAAFLDASKVARTSPVDGVHMDAKELRAIGRAAAVAVRALVG